MTYPLSKAALTGRVHFIDVANRVRTFWAELLDEIEEESAAAMTPAEY